MNHYYTSFEEYIFAFFEANPTFDTFRPPAPPHHSIYYPTWFSPDLQTTPDLVNHTHDLDIGFHISEQHAGVYSSNDQFKEVEATESPRLSRPSTPSALETRTPNTGSRNRSKSGRKTVPSRRPRSRRAALGVRYSTFEDRLKEEDPYVLRIWEEENKVLCGGCRNRIQLDNRKPRSLHLQNWDTHRRRCYRRKDKEQQLTELIRQGLRSPPSSSSHD